MRAIGSATTTPAARRAITSGSRLCSSRRSSRSLLPAKVALRLVGHGLLLHAHPLLGHGPLLDHRLLLVQHDLVLLLGDLRPLEGLVDVPVGDRLALEAELPALHREPPRPPLGGPVAA